MATCSNIRTFCSREHVSDWVERTGHAPVATVELEQLHRLALPWYGDRLDPDWEPQTQEHRQRLLDECGLSGPFWKLP